MLSLYGFLSFLPAGEDGILVFFFSHQHIYTRRIVTPMFRVVTLFKVGKRERSSRYEPLKRLGLVLFLTNLCNFLDFFYCRVVLNIYLVLKSEFISLLKILFLNIILLSGNHLDELRTCGQLHPEAK